MARETLTSILNKLHAMHAVGATTMQGIARATGHHRQDVHHWITKRIHAPNGKSTMKLFNFASRMSNRIAFGPRKTQGLYRAAYRDACDKFPVEE